MSIFTELYIETPLSLREMATLLGFSGGDELPPVMGDKIYIRTHDIPIRIQMVSVDEHNQGLLYSLKADFEISILSHIYYEDFLGLTVEIIKTTSYNLGLFVDFQDEPILIRKDQKLSLNSNPNHWTPEYLDMFRDIPHDFVDF